MLIYSKVAFTLWFQTQFRMIFYPLEIKIQYYQHIWTRHEQYYWRWHWHWLFGGIDIDNWHWIGDFWIIDIDIDIDVGQLSWLNIDIDIEVRKTLTLILTLRVFLKKIIDIDIEHWVFYIEVFEKVFIDVEYPCSAKSCLFHHIFLRRQTRQDGPFFQRKSPTLSSITQGCLERLTQMLFL